ncbi:MAG: GNAT family N-acetyltransferase [Eubacteriales bacterium]|nr:GNAT family N-acetyltransferase [Eubacteriales bacterium]
MVTIKKVESKADRREFVNFPDKLFAGNPHYVPELKSDAHEYIDPKKNPSWQVYEGQCFLAVKDGKTVGRIIAILNERSNQMHGGDYARFGTMDFIDDPEVSAALLGAVEDWARAHGKTQIHGPLGFCDSDPEGLLVEGFEEQDLSITPYAAPYYKEHLERLGYVKAVDWKEYLVSVPGPEVRDKLERLSEMITKRFGFRVQSFTRAKDMMEISRKFMDLTMDAYKDLYGYVPMQPQQVDSLINKFFPLINPAFVKMVYNKEGELIAGGVAMPSLAKTLQRTKGRMFPFGWADMLHAMKKNDRMELLLVAVKKEYQGRGVTALLLSAMVKSAIEQGYRYAETGPELETNDRVQAMWKDFETRQHRRRRVYEKTL